MPLNDITITKRTGTSHQMWEGLEIISVKFALSDGTVKLAQMSVDYAKVFAKELLRQCGERV